MQCVDAFEKTLPPDTHGEVGLNEEKYAFFYGFYVDKPNLLGRQLGSNTDELAACTQIARVLFLCMFFI